MNWLLQIFDPATIGAFFTQFHDEMQKPTFWLAVGKIIWINVLLSGDNALVIALACRGLQPRQRLWGMMLGAGAAVVLRIIFTGIVATLMELPYLKLVGGLALIVIAAKLLVPEDEDEDGVESASHLWAGGADRRRRRHRHEPRQRDRGRRRRQRQRAAADPRPRHQHSPDRRRRRADHGAARRGLPILVWAGAALARLDRGRGDRDRSGGASEAARLSSTARSALKLDAMLGDLRRIAAHRSMRSGPSIVCAVLGVVVVLVVGSIWRRRRLGNPHSACRTARRRRHVSV